jgi:acyl-CoA thioester hydrolase
MQGSFSFPIRIYWEDTDAGGIVFYANWLKFFERARTEWLRSLGIEQGRLREETGGIFVVAETSVRYLRPARLDDRLRVTASLQELARASLVISQDAFDDTSGALLAQGTIRIGWVDAATLRPARIPRMIMQALGQG